MLGIGIECALPYGKKRKAARKLNGANLSRPLPDPDSPRRVLGDSGACLLGEDHHEYPLGECATRQLPPSRDKQVWMTLRNELGKFVGANLHAGLECRGAAGRPRNRGENASIVVPIGIIGQPPGGLVRVPIASTGEKGDPGRTAWPLSE